MRALKAKKLRKALNFHPADEREYERKGIQCIATGASRSYQAVKRAPVLTEAVLRSAMLGV